MAIRITGMYSGLDTESIINELASAQSYKKNKLVKAQTKLSWKQDAWKALNTKIYNFYTNTLSDMRFESSFIKKSTKVSNSNAISIVSGDKAVNGVNTVKVDKLAKTAYLTGGDLTTADGVKFTSQATLKQLGFSGEGSFSISGSGVTMNIDVNEDMTLDEVAAKIQATGLNASFDQDNQRFFISSKSSGTFNNFTLSANDSKGMEALSKLGLLSKNDLISDDYTKWASYATDTDAYQKVLDAEVAKRAAAYKKTNDDLAAENAQIAEKELEVQYAADVQRGKEAAQELVALNQTQPETVEEGAEEYVAAIGLNDPGKRQLHIAIMGNRLSVAVDGFYAVQDVEVTASAAGYVYLQSGWGGEAYSQRNLTDDVYDGVFVDLEITQNTGAEKETVLYDNKLHGFSWVGWKAGEIWNSVLNWFIKTF